MVETLLEKDAFRYLSICSFLFASSVDSLIPRPPNSMSQSVGAVVCAVEDIVWGKGEECV